MRHIGIFVTTGLVGLALSGCAAETGEEREGAVEQTSSSLTCSSGPDNATINVTSSTHPALWSSTSPSDQYGTQCGVGGDGYVVRVVFAGHASAPNNYWRGVANWADTPPQDSLTCQNSFVEVEAQYCDYDGCYHDDSGVVRKYGTWDTLRGCVFLSASTPYVDVSAYPCIAVRVVGRAYMGFGRSVGPRKVQVGAQVQ